MKKVLLILILNVFTFSIVSGASYDSNLTGAVIKPSSSTGGTCIGSNYWIGFTQRNYKAQGLRFSFYDESGLQVGNSIDIWAWGKKFEDEYSKSIGDKFDEQYMSGWIETLNTINNSINEIGAQELNASNRYPLNKTVEDAMNKILNACKSSKYSNKELNLSSLKGKIETFKSSRSPSNFQNLKKEYERVNKIVKNLEGKVKSASANNFIVYLSTKNHSRDYLSKVDYLKIDNLKGKKLEDLFDGGYYIYYYDITGNEQNKYTRYVEDGKVLYQVEGNLIYSSQPANKQPLKAYLTNADVMKRYINLAQASGLIDVNEGNYTVLIEPIVAISNCATNSYGGWYTASDINFLLLTKKASANDNLLRFPSWLKIENELKIGEMTFTVDTSGTSYKFSPSEVFSYRGIGMAGILGSEVCKQNCTTNKKYKIIYRTFDLNHPFLNKDGTNRVLNNYSNWCEEKDNNSTSCAKIYEIDNKVYDKEPFLTVSLSPSDIKAIRENNKTINYANLSKETCSKFRSDFFNIFAPEFDFCN